MNLLLQLLKPANDAQSSRGPKPTSANLGSPDLPATQPGSTGSEWRPDAPAMSSRSGSPPVSPSHSHLQLQFGASLEELSITLAHDGNESDGNAHCGRSFLRLRLQQLALHHQRRAGGALMLCLSGNTLDCYDLRQAHHVYHIVGAAGRRTHNPLTTEREVSATADRAREERHRSHARPTIYAHHPLLPLHYEKPVRAAFGLAADGDDREASLSRPSTA